MLIYVAQNIFIHIFQVLFSFQDTSNCQAIINTYLDKISSASNDFYDEYYTKLPSVMYYTVSIKDIVSEKSNSIITFNSYPYLGLIY